MDTTPINVNESNALNDDNEVAEICSQSPTSNKPAVDRLLQFQLAQKNAEENRLQHMAERKKKIEELRKKDEARRQKAEERRRAMEESKEGQRGSGKTSGGDLSIDQSSIHNQSSAGGSGRLPRGMAQSCYGGFLDISSGHSPKTSDLMVSSGRRSGPATGAPFSASTTPRSFSAQRRRPSTGGPAFGSSTPRDICIGWPSPRSMRASNNHYTATFTTTTASHTTTSTAAATSVHASVSASISPASHHSVHQRHAFCMIPRTVDPFSPFDRWQSCSELRKTKRKQRHRSGGRTLTTSTRTTTTTKAAVVGASAQAGGGTSAATAAGGTARMSRSVHYAAPSGRSASDVRRSNQTKFKIKHDPMSESVDGANLFKSSSISGSGGGPTTSESKRRAVRTVAQVKSSLTPTSSPAKSSASSSGGMRRPMKSSGDVLLTSSGHSTPASVDAAEERDAGINKTFERLAKPKQRRVTATPASSAADAPSSESATSATTTPSIVKKKVRSSAPPPTATSTPVPPPMTSSNKHTVGVRVIAMDCGSADDSSATPTLDSTLDTTASTMDPEEISKQQEVEDYRQKLAEQRRIARENREKEETEKKRQLEEAKQRAAEERERMQREAMRARELEEERLKAEQEAQAEREAAERRLQEEKELEERKRKENEETQREERLRLEDEQRLERKKKLDAIMQRVGPKPNDAAAATAAATAASTVSTPTPTAAPPPPTEQAQQQPLATLAFNEDNQKSPEEEGIHTTTAPQVEPPPKADTLADQGSAKPQFKSALLQSLLGDGRLASKNLSQLRPADVRNSGSDAALSQSMSSHSNDVSAANALRRNSSAISRTNDANESLNAQPSVICSNNSHVKDLDENEFSHSEDFLSPSSQSHLNSVHSLKPLIEESAEQKIQYSNGQGDDKQPLMSCVVENNNASFY